ncbi:MAG: hypothetical protein Kow0069_11910 [Promethearchaeota archaeon]
MKVRATPLVLIASFVAWEVALAAAFPSVFSWDAHARLALADAGLGHVFLNPQVQWPPLYQVYLWALLQVTRSTWAFKAGSIAWSAAAVAAYWRFLRGLLDGYRRVAACATFAFCSPFATFANVPYAEGAFLAFAFLGAAKLRDDPGSIGGLLALAAAALTRVEGLLVASAFVLATTMGGGVAGGGGGGGESGNGSRRSKPARLLARWACAAGPVVAWWSTQVLASGWSALQPAWDLYLPYSAGGGLSWVGLSTSLRYYALDACLFLMGPLSLAGVAGTVVAVRDAPNQRDRREAWVALALAFLLVVEFAAVVVHGAKNDVFNARLMALPVLLLGYFAARWPALDSPGRRGVAARVAFLASFVPFLAWNVALTWASQQALHALAASGAFAGVYEPVLSPGQPSIFDLK